MSIWPKRAPVARPKTYVGLWLRAALLNQPELQKQLGVTLNGGKADWNYDEPAVVEAVCVLALRRRFPSGADPQAITAFVSGVRNRIHSETPPGQRETEAVIRFALGDPDVRVGHIPTLELLLAQYVTAAEACIQLGLDEAAINQMIIEGERVAWEQGWQPPLAD